jgi:hypothetical protein
MLSLSLVGSDEDGEFTSSRLASLHPLGELRLKPTPALPYKAQQGLALDNHYVYAVARSCHNCPEDIHTPQVVTQLIDAASGILKLQGGDLEREDFISQLCSVNVLVAS